MLDRDFSSLIKDRNLAIATILDPRIKTFVFASLEPGTPGGQAREFLYQAAASVQFRKQSRWNAYQHPAFGNIWNIERHLLTIN